jgi:fumarate reductase subunit D
MVAALLVPVHALVNLLFGLGILDPDALAFSKFSNLLANPLVKLYLLALFTLPFFHAAHRVRGTIRDMGLHADQVVGFLCYGAATVVSIWAVVVLLSVP